MSTDKNAFYAQSVTLKMGSYLFKAHFDGDSNYAGTNVLVPISVVGLT